MNYEFSEEQLMLRKAARDFLAEECPESLVRALERSEAGYSLESWRKIADLGWLGLVYPERYGGSGGNFMDLAVLYEEIGRAMFPGPHLSTVVLCGLTILNAGTEEQKAEILPRIAGGDLIMALALTEPEASWDDRAWEPGGVTVRASRSGNDYVINGTKLFVHDAHIADQILCVARTRRGARPENGITLFLVDAGSPGIGLTPLRTTAGDKQFEVTFDEVKVPASNIVGKLNGGWSPLWRSIQVGAMMLCAEMLGAGWRILEMAVDYAKTRVQFDAPIGVNQYIQGYCTDLVADIDGCQWLTYHAAWRLSENLPCDFEVAVAKAWTSEAHERACLNAHAVLAGVGYTTKAGILPLYTRRGKTQQLYLGNGSFWRKKVADVIAEWPAPVRPRGKPLGLWNKPPEEAVPVWPVWKKEDFSDS
ncbi:MAG: acyl-CoA/acyl-ACP dehydrogenase [Chloroflexi bacterium]|nr:acyl-CoA/acyl-ACP dehydrogenase [Chloroflexota bacterium]